MAGPATILREIHRLRRFAADLKAEIERIPHVTRLQQAKVDRQEEVLRDTHETIKRLKLTSHDRELQLKTNLQQVIKHEDQLNQAGSKKEYDALKVEIYEQPFALDKAKRDVRKMRQSIRAVSVKDNVAYTR